MLRWALAFCVVGCHASETAPSASAPQEAKGCAPGELTLDDGSCQPAGVPEGECGEGFVAEARGCTPILPPEGCPDGMMAVPGDTACREVAMCEDIAIEPNAVFVDAAYMGGDSDGSASKPFVTLASAFNAAPAGAQVVLAPGDYPENVADI